MKATMKKVVAMMLVMVMLCVPVVAYAAAGDSEAEAIPVADTASVTVPAGATVYYAYSGVAGTQYNLTVTGATGFEVSTPHPWTGMLVPTPDVDGAITVPVTAGAMWSMTPGVASFAITNSTDAEQTYSIEIVMPKGTQNNPEELVLGSAESASADGSAYWYTWTAAEDGTFVINFANGGSENGWEYTVVVNGEYITSHTSSEAEGDPTVVMSEVSMAAGDVLTLGINNYDWIPGVVVSFETSFTAGAAAPAADKTINLTYANGYDWMATNVYVFASTEGQTIVDIHGNPDFPYFYHVLLQYNEETEKFEVVNYDNAFAGEYVNWTINENQIAIMAHDSCADAASLDALKTLEIGDAFYLVGDYNAILSGAGALEGTYLTTDDTVDHWAIVPPKTINLTYANGYDWMATSVYVFASTEGQTIVDIHGNPDFPYFYHVLLQYNEATEKFEVVNYDNAFAGEYVNWTINENQIAVMAHDACADAASLDALKTLEIGDAFYLVGDYNAILSGAGALEGTYLTNQNVDHWTPSAGGDEGVNYEEMGIALQLGEDQVYDASTMYAYSIYTFEPTEIGKYTISSTDSLLGIVSYNGMWITIDPSAETVAENSVVWECTSVGQSIWVAAMPEANIATITVAKEDITVVDIPKVDYENTVTPEEFTFNGDVEDLLYVNTEDDVVDTAVLGEDGFYHLNSADGPILYVDLDDEIMNLADAMGYGQLKDTVTEDGEIVSIIDYNTAFGEYYACADENGLYPLTADLMAIYQNVGKYQGWYGEEGWVGGVEEDAWMFACYYVEGENTKPDAGDASNALVFAILALVAVAGTAVVVKTRR